VRAASDSFRHIIPLSFAVALIERQRNSGRMAQVAKSFPRFAIAQCGLRIGIASFIIHLSAPT
jgi:hypothetical protein